MKSALIIGASRGIGRQMALTLSRNGYAVGVAAKSVDSSPDLPGNKPLHGEIPCSLLPSKIAPWLLAP